MNNRNNHNGRNSCKDSDSYLHNHKDKSTDGYTDTYTHTYTHTYTYNPVDVYREYAYTSIRDEVVMVVMLNFCSISYSSVSLVMMLRPRPSSWTVIRRWVQLPKRVQNSIAKSIKRKLEVKANEKQK